MSNRNSIPSIVISLLAILIASATFSPPVFADLAAEVAAVRAVASTGQYDQAFKQGIAVLNAFEESHWDRADLRRFIQEVSDRWFERMSPEDQRTAVASIETPLTNPAAQAALCYASFFTGNQSQAIAEGQSLILEHPDSVAADLAIEGIFQAFYYDKNWEGLTSMVRGFVERAPNNRATGWALCRLSWLHCAKRRVLLARETNEEVVRKKPDTLAAEVAAKLNTLIDLIAAEQYSGAFSQMLVLQEYTAESVIVDILDTFLINIDFTPAGLAASADQVQTLDAAMTTLSKNTLVPILGDLALCISGRRHERSREKETAITQYQRVMDNGNWVLEEYAAPRIANLCHRTDPQRAIVLLELYRKHCGKAAGAVWNVQKLANLYTAQGDYESALSVFQSIESRRLHGELIVKEMELRPREGIMVCLNELGRSGEAQALAQEILAESGYDSKPLNEMSLRNVYAASKALRILERDNAASQAEADIAQRKQR